MDKTQIADTYSSISEDNCRASYIVGIGASAGGLEALERLVHKIPNNCGMAFVVIQHLSPDFDSMMDELLSRHTEIPIHTVKDGMQLCRNVIYLIPPKKEAIISGDRLLLADRDPTESLNLPINTFFRSLAQEAGARSIGIILSGTGSDGSRGIRDIHDAGGLVIAQDEETAKFDGMPKSAVETGAVDLVLAPELMAEALAKYAKHPVRGDLASESQTPPVDEDGMNKLMRLLHDATGIDFSLYKPSTVQRRIERRLVLAESEDFDLYVDKVASDPGELNSLYHDLLIGVTQFFRDIDAFNLLESQVLPELLSKLSSEDELRIWVPGCATGEEAYSLAILVHEQFARMGRPLDAKIFATDVHKASLDAASSGIYDENSLANVSSQRLQRYFIPKGNLYQVVPELRQMIVFATHNVIKDAPFTRMDLISCRNLLIYFQPQGQKKSISLFHFGLKTGGVLLLGPSEGVSDFEDEFVPIDRHWKIFRKRRNVRFPADMRLPLTPVPHLQVSRGTTSNSWTCASDNDLAEVYDQLLDRYIPPAVLVNNRREIVHIFGDASVFLRFKPGRATTDVLELFDSDFKTAVSGAIQRASKELETVAYSGIKIDTLTGPQHVKLGVTPFLDRNQALTHMLITLDPVQSSEIVSQKEEPLDMKDVSRRRIDTLESELRHTKENLQATIEELETSNEELHATNEELVASNEELQSTNEELHSVNEELYTVNAEYQRKVTELTELTDDIQNLLTNTEIGVLFLDKNLCIRKFTPQISRLFNIVEHDVGRSFDNFTHNIDYDTLAEDIKEVLNTGTSTEREVHDRFDHWYFLRVLPYRAKSEVEGIVITLIDIGVLKKTEAEVQEKDRQLQGILDNSPYFIFIKDMGGHYILANERSKYVVGLGSSEIIGKTDYELLPQKVADRMEAQDREVVNTGKSMEIEETVRHLNRVRTYLSLKYPLRDESGHITAIAGIWTDITKQKRAHRKAKKAIEHRDRFLATLSHELRNPLAAIRSAAQLLHKYGSEINGAVKKTADVVGRQASQMANLLDDLLDVSRITRDKIELRKQVADLRRTSDDAITAIRSSIGKHDIKLRTDLPEEPVYVYGDLVRLQQVQVNLLVNAVKFTPAGGCIDFSISKNKDRAIIRIADTGIGIPRNIIKNIFDPFVQGNAVVDNSEVGMGLGLTLVRSLVEMHDGAITVNSDGKGKGTEFIVDLPLAEPPEKSLQSEVPSENPSVDTEGLKLLVVEDNTDTREMMQMLLESYGYEVVTAADGLSAITSIEVEKPDVAFVDIGLPELDGYEVARRTRRRPGCETTFMVALTGYGQPADRRKAQDAGFDDHLTKPVDINDIWKILEKASCART